MTAAASTTIRARRIGPRDIPAAWRRVSTRRGVGLVARTWLGIGLAVALAAGVGHALAWVAAGILIGVFQYQLTVLSHHGVHGQLAGSRPLNDALTRWLLFAPVGMPLKAMRNNHLRHHARVGEDDDYDRWYYDLRLLGRFDAAGLRSWLRGMFLGGLIAPTLRKLTGRALEQPSGFAPPASAAREAMDLHDALAIAGAQAMLVGGLWAATGHFWAYAVLWILPLLTVMSGLNSIRSCLEHADLHDPPQRFLSFRSNALERFLVGPFNMNHHWEHHRFMSVSFQHLPEVRRLCLEADDYAPGRLIPSYWSHWKDLVRSLPAGGRATAGR